MGSEASNIHPTGTMIRIEASPMQTPPTRIEGGPTRLPDDFYAEAARHHAENRERADAKADELGTLLARALRLECQRDRLMECLRIIATTPAETPAFARHLAATIVNVEDDCDAFPWADLQGVLDGKPRQNMDRARSAIEEARAA